MPNALVVADDLTGTLDTGHGFATRGRGVTARLLGGVTRHSRESKADTDSDVLAIDTDSRSVDPDDAVRIVRSVVDDIDADVVYKKIDSTLRGNVVAEVDAALDASGAAAGIVAPAFPETGRTTRDGIHFVDEVPLADAGYPVDESALPTVFAASEYSVERLALSTVERGADSVSDTLRNTVRSTAEPPLIICDAVTAEHLATIAAGADTLAESVLYVGSGGLAAHATVPGDSRTSTPPPQSGQGVVSVVGSINPRTLEQLEACPDEDVIRLDPAAAVRDPESVARNTAPTVVQRTRDRSRAIVTAAVDTTDVDRAEATATELSEIQNDDYDAGGRVARALAGTIERALTGDDAVDPSRLFLTGGDVARETLDALSVTTIRLTGRAVDAGLPVGWIADGPAADTHLITKAGGFGDEKTIVNCLRPVGGDNE